MKLVLSCSTPPFPALITTSSQAPFFEAVSPPCQQYMMSFSARRVSILRTSDLAEASPLRRFSTHKAPSSQGEPRQANLNFSLDLLTFSTEQDSPAHKKFRETHAHKAHSGLDESRSSTGVIWCTEQAAEYGFLDKPTEWANLGQGAPEVDDEIDGCFRRPDSIPLSMNAREYGPTAGIKTLRSAIANLYNADYRKGMKSQYSWENVCVVPGGRCLKPAKTAHLTIPRSSRTDPNRCGTGQCVCGLLHSRLHCIQRDVIPLQECMSSQPSALTFSDA